MGSAAVCDLVSTCCSPSSGDHPRRDLGYGGACPWRTSVGVRNERWWVRSSVESRDRGLEEKKMASREDAGFKTRTRESEV